MEYPKPITRLIEAFRKLPGIGPRSAQRMAWHVLEGNYDAAVELARAVVGVKKSINRCSLCGYYTENDPCSVCSDVSRDKSMICVVESAEDMLAIERAGGYGGLYHVLGGTISPTAGRGPDAIRAQELADRVRGGNIQEIIIATNPTIEGEATTLYLVEMLQPFSVRITRPAHGIPMGADLDFLDGDTLTRAMKSRAEMGHNQTKK